MRTSKLDVLCGICKIARLLIRHNFLGEPKENQHGERMMEML